MTEPETPFSATVDVEGDVIRVVVTGVVDPATAGTLEGEIRAALFGAPDATQLDLDLSAVSFMDSSGLRVLIGAMQAVRDRDGTLEVRNPSPTVAQLLEVTKLTGELTIATD